MGVKIKICGLQRPEDVAIINRARPDYAGFIFARGRRRYVSPEAVAAMRAVLDEGITPVGVFVDEPMDSLLKIADRAGIEVIQLHGQEDAAYIRALKARTRRPVIKAAAIPSVREAELALQVQTGAEARDSDADALRMEALRRAEASPADAILLDSGRGGTGESFGWALLRHARRPFFLAGGLNCDNIGEAIRDLSPYGMLAGLDVSSGAESGGVKDKAKVAELVRQSREQCGMNKG